MEDKVKYEMPSLKKKTYLDGFYDGKQECKNTMYSEEEVKTILIERNKMFSTKIESFSNLLLKQDLEWFEQNKKK